MAFQFQAVAALSPFLIQSYGIGFAEIGFLIGLYLSPGIVIALPGGAIGRWFGDKRAVAFGMVLMLAGGLMIALLPVWEAQIAGRLIAGTGGVILNVLMSKMITDWFRDADLATAMGIFVNSWPVGIAAALLVLPPIAEHSGLPVTLGFINASILLGLLLLLALYRDADQTDPAPVTAQSGIGGRAITGLLAAGFIWGLYNAALAMVFSFGPAMLAERGTDATAASFTTSLTLWMVAISVPLGGYLADRLGQRDLVLAAGLIAFCALMFYAPRSDLVVPVFIALGLVAGLSAGPIMSLPADVLAPKARAVGMGLFFALYYLSIFLAPLVAGRFADVIGTAAITFSFGGSLLLICVGLHGLFLAVASRTQPS